MQTENKKSTNFQIRADANSFVHEALGLDVREISDIQFDQLERSFDHGGVLFMRNQDLQTADLVAFSRRFGELESHVRHEYAMPDYPEVHVLSNIKKGNNMTDLSSKIKLYLIITMIFLSACNDSSGGVY